VKGKISYLSPEQARGQRVDQRSDLFSLGIVMWEMLTVERLYKHDSDYDTMKAIIHRETPPPSSRRRDVPPELDALVLRALAKAPDERFQTAEELAEAIERVAVQTSSPLSAAGLSRFLRELFGARPEPWRTLAATEERAEIVTVTSEPIPQELKIPINDPVDRRLAAVVDLSVSEPLDLGSVPPLALAPAPRLETLPPAAVPAREPAPWLRRRGPLVLGALVLGVAVTVALVVAFGSDELPAAAARDEAAPPAQAQVAAGPSAAAVTPAMPEPPIPEPPTPAAPAPAADPPAVPSPAGKARPRPARTPPSRKGIDLAKELESGHYPEVVAECSANAAADRALCVRAACHAGDTAKAQRWILRVAAARQARLVDACAELGVKLAGERRESNPDPKPNAKPDCADPMDCPR